MHNDIFNHDFGYGTNSSINKLRLNNELDILKYIQDVVETNFDISDCVYKVSENTIKIFDTIITVQQC